jgi:ubiquinone/menaquinone biosynthesis C-methylase UbiE
MDIYHKLFTVARREQLHQAPIPQHGEPPRILDIGCGTGIWAIDMAEYVALQRAIYVSRS